jgi:hypothetical protein
MKKKMFLSTVIFATESGTPKNEYKKILVFS